MNSWSFTGNVGSVKDLHYTPNGHAVLGFSVAVNSGWGDNKKTTWANCSLWGDRAEKLSLCIAKGSQIGIVGEITELRSYESNGKSGVSLEVNVKDVTLLGSKKNVTTDEQGDYGFDGVEF